MPSTTAGVLSIKTILDGFAKLRNKKKVRRRKKVGRVEIPQDAFLAVLKVNE
jgi:translation elongation factor EF-4